MNSTLWIQKTTILYPHTACVVPSKCHTRAILHNKADKQIHSQCIWSTCLHGNESTCGKKKSTSTPSLLRTFKKKKKKRDEIEWNLRLWHNYSQLTQRVIQNSSFSWFLSWFLSEISARSSNVLLCVKKLLRTWAEPLVEILSAVQKSAVRSAVGHGDGPLTRPQRRCWTRVVHDNENWNAWHPNNVDQFGKFLLNSCLATSS